MQPSFFILALPSLLLLLVVVLIPVVILIKITSQRSRLLVQGALLLVLGVLSLIGAIAVGVAEGGELQPEIATNISSTLLRIAVVLILSALASCFLSYDFRLRRDKEGGAANGQ